MDTLFKAQAVRFNRARNNLLAVVAFTTINLFLIAFEMDLSFLFSAFVPQFLQVIIHDELGMVAGLVVGLVSGSVYLLCYALSKRWRVFILIALILFSLDALAMLGFILYFEVFRDFLFNVVFHAWVLFYLLTGTVAWLRLRRVAQADYQTLQQTVQHEAQAQEVNSAMQVVAPVQGSGNDFGFGYENDGGHLYVLDDFVRASIYAAFTPADKLYLFGDAPYDKLENARHSYAAAMGADETLILFYDDTVRGSGNEGFILTNKRLYCKNFGMDGDAMFVSSINELFVPKFGLVSTHVIVKSATRGEMEVHITQPKAKAGAVYGALSRVIDVLRGQGR